MPVTHSHDASHDVSPADSAPLRLAVIVGSVRSGRFGPTVAHWFAEQAAARDDLAVDILDTAEADLPLRMPDSGHPAPEVSERLDRADAFVVVTPEYNHSYPAALKNLIDWHREEWYAKPVGFVSYGGVSGGLRAVEHLRAVFAELHAVTVRDAVSFHSVRDRFDHRGRPVDPAGPGGAAKVMLDQLAWWAGALRRARDLSPYAA